MRKRSRSVRGFRIPVPAEESEVGNRSPGILLADMVMESH